MATSASFWIVTLCLTLTRHFSEGKNVVFLPVTVTSHARLHAFVAEELVKMGHRVWIGLPSALYNNEAETYHGVTAFKYNDSWDASQEYFIARLEAALSEAITTGTELSLDLIWKFGEEVSEGYFKSMKEGNFIEFLEILQPDLLVLDWFPNVDERVAAAYKLKVPFAIVSPLLDPVTARIPFSPAAEAYNYPYISTKANIFEKLDLIIQFMASLFIHLFNDRGYMQQLFPADPSAPAANELMSQAEVYIIASDTVLYPPRPTVPNVKLVGAVSASPAKELRQPFKSFVDRSEKAGVGVAVLSFGSMFLNLPKGVETKIVTALKRLGLNTIWRANITSPDPIKILTSTWLPVNDLLGHTNIKVFISHCGIHSLYEALYHAIPTVCVPLCSDQHPNAEKAEKRGYCLTVDIIKASSDDLVKAIEHTVSNQQMKLTLSTASEIYHQLFKNPRQEAAFWLDHVMRYGGSYMRYSGQKMPMVLFILDYILVFVAGMTAAIISIIIVCAATLIFRFWVTRQIHLKND